MQLLELRKRLDATPNTNSHAHAASIGDGLRDDDDDDEEDGDVPPLRGTHCNRTRHTLSTHTLVVHHSIFAPL